MYSGVELLAAAAAEASEAGTLVVEDLVPKGPVRATLNPDMAGALDDGRDGVPDGFIDRICGHLRRRQGTDGAAWRVRQESTADASTQRAPV